MAKSTKHSAKKSAKSVKTTKNQPTRTPQKPAMKAKAPKASKMPAQSKSLFPRVASNPFRQGSSYGACYDILAAHPEGLPRQKLVELLSKAISGKSLKNAAYDAGVIITARADFRHRSCRPGFIVIKENDNVRMEVVTAPAPKTAGK